ncbi:MAG: MATE family efflux transporter [Lachnospiraceae bacterium]|nr:MATE family efflux transporter [Lachnospiraceae bacterium]MBR5733866.1 MATE family efflux transporter [Lachnospiraceae bacterium]
MNKNKKYEMDMCSGPILSKMLMFALPLMLSSVLQLLFNAADVVVVGKFAGDNSLAAVGCTGSLVNLLVNLFVGLSVGANVMSARHFGAKQYDELSRTVHTAITVAAISGIILTFIGVVFADNILRLMSTPEPVLPLAALYLRIYFGGMVANMLYNFGSAILRAVGDTKRPMYFLTFAGVVNVVLNLIFVIVLKMDVAGVAIATVISQCISAFLVLRCLIMETGAIHLDVKKLGIDAAEFKNIVRIGLPAGLQGCVFSLSNVVIQSSINSFGETVVSGSAASANLEGFVYVAMNSFHHATLNFMSQNFGAGKYSRMKKVMICGLGCVIVAGLALGNLEVFFGRRLLSLYTSSPAVIEAGITRLTINNTLYCLCGMMDVMVGVLRGIGYSVMPMIVSLVGACGTRLLWIATVFQIASFHRIETVYIAYPISWFLTFAAHVVCYFIVRRKAIPAVDKTVAE